MKRHYNSEIDQSGNYGKTYSSPSAKKSCYRHESRPTQYAKQDPKRYYPNRESQSGYYDQNHLKAEPKHTHSHFENSPSRHFKRVEKRQYPDDEDQNDYLNYQEYPNFTGKRPRYQTGSTQSYLIKPDSKYKLDNRASKIIAGRDTDKSNEPTCKSTDNMKYIEKNVYFVDPDKLEKEIYDVSNWQEGGLDYADYE